MPPPRDLGRRLREKVRAAGYGSQLYAYTLKGRVPEELAHAPDDIWPGDRDTADALFQGRFAFAGEELTVVNEAPWGRPRPSETWAAELHGFAWLRHFGASGVAVAARHARELVRAWIAGEGGWEAVSWRPDVLGRRLLSWLSHAGFVLEGADEAFRSAFLASLAEQTRHLARAAGGAPDGAPRLAAAVALAAAELCLGSGEPRLKRALRGVERELERQILADGGHVSRNPAAQLAALRDLVVLRELLRGARREVPPALPGAIDRMAPMLRFFRHGDGGLALFNGGDEQRADLIDVTLSRAEAGGRPLDEAPASGFQRLAAGRALVLVDAGAPPPPEFSDEAHAGTLGFEMGLGRERLIVNCGPARHRGEEWRRAMRGTAAHSTLVIGDTSSSEVRADGRIGRRPGEVRCRRREDGGNIWLESAHDGYAEPFGLEHRRRLYLDASGEELRGEDTVAGPGLAAAAGTPVAVRFHLHPGVRASLSQDGGAAWLRLPSGAGWRLRAAGGALALDDSVYGGSGMRRSQQVVLSAPLGSGELAFKWALARVRSDS